MRIPNIRLLSKTKIQRVERAMFFVIVKTPFLDNWHWLFQLYFCFQSDVTLTVDFFRCEDARDQQFGSELIACLRTLADFQLSSAEVSLLSAIVLMDSSDTQQDFVTKVRETLYAEFAARFDEPPLQLFGRLWQQVTRLRDLSRQHIICLTRFQHTVSAPVCKHLPPLYKELFSHESV